MNSDNCVVKLLERFRKMTWVPTHRVTRHYSSAGCLQQYANAKAGGNTASMIIRVVKAVEKVVGTLHRVEKEDREDSEKSRNGEDGNEDEVCIRLEEPACGSYTC